MIYNYIYCLSIILVITTPTAQCMMPTVGYLFDRYCLGGMVADFKAKHLFCGNLAYAVAGTAIMETKEQRMKK